MRVNIAVVNKVAPKSVKHFLKYNTKVFRLINNIKTVFERKLERKPVLRTTTSFILLKLEKNWNPKKLIEMEKKMKPVRLQNVSPWKNFHYDA